MFYFKNNFIKFNYNFNQYKIKLNKLKNKKVLINANIDNFYNKIFQIKIRIL